VVHAHAVPNLLDDCFAANRAWAREAKTRDPNCG
jgi:hypothetical protein